MTNTEFDYTLGGKTYSIKRASIKQVILFQRKVMEIQKEPEQDAGADLRIVAYAIYLLLKEADPNITEDFVQENAPGDIDAMATFQQLGFMNQQKMAIANKLQDLLANPKPQEKPLDGQESSQP